MVEPFEPATSGFSNETLLFRARWTEDGRERQGRYVFRSTPQGDPLFPNYDLALQYNVMRCLAGSPVPVPGMVLFEPDARVLGSPFLIMNHVDGVVASGRRPGFHGHGLFFEASPEMRRAMWFEAVDQMAALHQLDYRALGVAPWLGNPAGGQDALQRRIDQLAAWLVWADMGPLPVLEAGLEWVRRHAYASSRLSLLWGDARPGNIIYRDGKAAAVIDWELASIGNGEFDLAYFILADAVTAEINQVPRLSGLPSAEETIAHYESRMGRPVKNYMYASIFEALRFAVMLTLVVRAAPPNLSYGAGFLTENVAVRRLKMLLDSAT